MPRKLLVLALLPVAAAATFAGVFFSFYQGGYDAPPTVDVPYDEITSPGAVPAAPDDSGIPQNREGLLLVDAMHVNSVSEREIATLTSLVADRGYDVELLGNFDIRGTVSRLERLKRKLREADSFLVMLPQATYSEAEVAVVERFVDKGGKLVLVSDPTRPSRINSLAKRFGVEFQPDYLYNTVEYDLNFRHIFVRDFQPSPLTSGLNTVALYITGSIQSSGEGLAFADANTRSSLENPADTHVAMALGDRRNVVAIADFTFIVPPYNTLLDNDRLLSNLADFLSDNQREYDLGDFPHFYDGGQGESVDILLGQPSLWDIGLGMRNGLTDYGISSRISEEEDVSRNTVFLGLYEDSPAVGRYLQAAGVSVNETVSLPFAPEVPSEGTSIVLLHRSQGRYALVMLGNTPYDLAEAADSLLSGEFRDTLVSDYLGLRNNP